MFSKISVMYPKILLISSIVLIGTLFILFSSAWIVLFETLFNVLEVLFFTSIFVVFSSSVIYFLEFIRKNRNTKNLSDINKKETSLVIIAFLSIMAGVWFVVQMAFLYAY
jgi:hypothetical protein